MLEIKNISKSYNSKKVIDRISYKFNKKGLYCLVGPSGCGKTTLLNIISSVENDFMGEVIFNNKRINKSSIKDKELYRLKNIGYVFQSFNLFNLDTVFNNVLLPFDTLSNANEFSKNRRVEDLLSFVNLLDRKSQKVSTLSGGEKQRIAIARALVNEPDILLCDEPTGALDEKSSIQIFQLLEKISYSKLVIVVTHDLELAKKYASTILKINDGKIIKEIKKRNKVKESKIPLFEIKATEKKPKMPYSFMFRHVRSTFKAKKVRTFITNMMTSLGLVGIGLTMLVSSSLSNEIKSAFSSVINDRQIVASLKSNNANLFGNVFSSTYDEALSVKNKYSDYVKDVGVNYIVNFENFFKHNNEVYVASTAYKYYLNQFSIRTFNDYMWLDETNKTIYPSRPKVLENDQIVIGLPYETMANLCFKLQILRNYESLGEYIDLNNFQIAVYVSNKNWEYDDEQIFRVMGVIQDDRPTIYHYNHKWNEWLFQEKMRLPTTINGDNIEYPWVMNKTYYLEVRNANEFLDKVMYDDSLNDYLFERASYSYYPNLCPISGKCYIDRVLIFLVDKDSIRLTDINHMQRVERRLKSYSFASSLGYTMYESSLMYGFSNNFYLSPYKEKIEKVIDSDSLIFDEINSEISLPEYVVKGSYLKSAAGGLIFSSLRKELLLGREANNIDEIVISNALYEHLNKPPLGSTLYCAMVVGETLFDFGKEKQFAETEITIVGVNNEKEKDAIFHNNDWTISFFRDKLGISSFYLLPRYVVFDIDNAKESNEIIDKLNKSFRDYEFSNPALEIGITIDETLSYVTLMLFSFSAISLLISMMLFIIVIYLNIMENEKEIVLMKYIGISNKDIRRLFTTYGLSIGLISFVISSIELIFLDLAFNKFLNSYFRTSISYSMNLTPFVILFVLTFVISFIFANIISSVLLKRKRY